MLPLTAAKPGETLVIKKITGQDQVRQHLAELGFVVDSKITVVNQIAGNLILQVNVRFYQNGAFIGDRSAFATVGAAEQWNGEVRYLVHADNVSNLDYKIYFANNTNG